MILSFPIHIVKLLAKWNLEYKTFPEKGFLNYVNLEYGPHWILTYVLYLIMNYHNRMDWSICPWHKSRIYWFNHFLFSITQQFYIIRVFCYELIKFMKMDQPKIKSSFSLDCKCQPLNGNSYANVTSSALWQ